MAEDAGSLSDSYLDEQDTIVLPVFPVGCALKDNLLTSSQGARIAMEESRKRHEAALNALCPGGADDVNEFKV